MEKVCIQSYKLGSVGRNSSQKKKKKKKKEKKEEEKDVTSDYDSHLKH